MYNEALEKVIAEILYHKQEYLDAGVVEASDFYTDYKQVVYKMVRLRKNGNLINETTIGSHLDLPNDADVAQFEDLVYALKNLNRERKMQGLPKEISAIVTEGINVDEKWMRISTLIEKFNTGTQKIDDFNIKTEVEEYAENLFNPETDFSHVPTGIQELDERCSGGFRNGEFVIIAGDSGNYKSTLMYNMAINVALRGETVMIFSYEVDRDEILEVFTSMFSQLNSREIKSGFFRHDLLKVEKVTESISKLSTLPIFIVDSHVRLNDVKLMAMAKKPAIIFIDYIQLMPDVGEDAVRSLEFITRQMKLMAGRNVLNCPLVALSQFSRNKENEERKMHDLKGSSALEQNPNIVIFTKATEKVARSDKVDCVEIKIVKNRHGVKGEFILPITKETHTINGEFRMVDWSK